MEAVEVGRIREDFEADSEYSAAIVFALGPSLRDAILQLREQFKPVVQARSLLLPHLTVAYIGRRRGDRLVPILAELRRQPLPDFPLSIRGIGSFNLEGRLANIHLKVRPPDAAVAAHFSSLALLESLGESSDTGFKGAAYIPHISLFDEIRSVSGPLPDPDDEPTLQGYTDGVHIMARREVPR